jgi:hypothetical protein
MKGLVFNLLENLARDAGCSDEAWEVVAEFAATEVLLDSGTDTSVGDVQAAGLFEVPAEAMVKCFARTDEDDHAEGADVIDMEAHAEWLGTFDLPDLVPSYYDALPTQPHAGFGSRAFTDLDVNSDAWFGDDDDD